MKKTLFFSSVLFSAVLSAAPVQINILDYGNGVKDSTGQYDVGPYNLLLDMKTATPAMCMDDFIFNNSGEWMANATAANSTNFNNTYLGSAGEKIDGHSFTSSQIYQAEAYLFSLIVKPGADQAGIQEAAWFIMDPNNPTYASNADMQSYLQLAANNAPTFDDSGYTILSAVDKNGTQQEFMVASAPEPTTVALLGAALLAAGVARFRRRKQMTA
ncbi:MAG TPA: PEP-CTERM sorting domain-containing protein [Bryobacteraceae bacterium]|nr:PEP-CTERM sorting domain-containing protein [Bryobacteraceae bacterium]